jgi:hypothetical protein
MPGVRSYAAGRTALDLDGVMCGFLQSVAGGAVTADVISTPGEGSFDQKHLGGVRYEELELQLDLSLDKLVYDWISASWKHNYIRRDGSIVATDHNIKAVSEREFFRGLVTEVTIPALDGASKDPVYLTVKIAPEYTRFKKGSGKVIKSAVGRQKEWLPSNFKLEIDGLDATKVTKIDAFSIKQKVQEDNIGEERIAVKEPGRIEFPNLHVTLAASGADTWTAWFDDFVVKGNNDQGKERNGKLTFLSTDHKTPLGVISFFNLGIYRLEPEPQRTGVEAIARVVAGLYCERMELSVP